MNYQLMIEANKLTNLGYEVGLASGKSLVDTFHAGMQAQFLGNIDAISVILNDLVCVDFDTHMHMDVGWGNDLPYTWKEKSPRGCHLFYRLPYDSLSRRETKVKWKPDVDLLTRGKTMRSRYGVSQTASAHVLVAPSPGYRKIYPDATPHHDELPMAPDWLVEAIKP